MLSDSAGIGPHATVATLAGPRAGEHGVTLATTAGIGRGGAGIAWDATIGGMPTHGIAAGIRWRQPAAAPRA